MKKEYILKRIFLFDQHLSEINNILINNIRAESEIDALSWELDSLIYLAESFYKTNHSSANLIVKTCFINSIDDNKVFEKIIHDLKTKWNVFIKQMNNEEFNRFLK